MTSAPTRSRNGLPGRLASTDGVAALLPNGWSDFFRQLAIWLGFVLGYQVARGLADRGPTEAFRNARRVIRVEEHLGGLVDLDLQRQALAAGEGLVHLANWTYWFAQFAFVAGGLVWIYLRRNGVYLQLRNTLIVANTLALVGYVVMPTAPPRLLSEYGFVDTLAQSEALNHGSGLVELVANPYAAMPSVHAADALIIGAALAAVVYRRWLKALFLVWPLWVCFSLLATANHFWLDVAAGVALAAFAAVVVGVYMGRPRGSTRAAGVRGNPRRDPAAHGCPVGER